jgi:hypothetical protein
MTIETLKTRPLVLRLPDVPNFCFLLASVTIVIGMSLGLYMALARDHQLMPVHAHLNVIGWLSLFMLGLYYRAHPAARGLCVRLQVTALAAGYLLMTTSLAALLTLGGNLFLAGALAGSVLLILSMVLLVGIVWRASVDA